MTPISSISGLYQGDRYRFRDGLRHYLTQRIGAEPAILKLMASSLPAPLAPLDWDRDEPPNTASVAERLREAGVDPSAWSNGPGDRYGVHEHSYTKLLVCAAGSITFLIGPDAVPVELKPGDGFVLPPGTPHAAVVGMAGCTCLEGHR